MRWAWPHRRLHRGSGSAAAIPESGGAADLRLCNGRPHGVSATGSCGQASLLAAANPLFDEARGRQARNAAYRADPSPPARRGRRLQKPCLSGKSNRPAIRRFYSNGLRIDTRFTVSNRPRLYTAFPAGWRLRINPIRRTQPAGIVYHTTESCQAPFEAQDTPVLKRLGESLLEYVCRKRAYHYLIDRFGRVYRVVAESDTANHAGYSVWADDESFYVNLNESFLGISFEAQTQPGQTEGAGEPGPGPRCRHADRNAPQPLPDSRRELRHARAGVREPLEHAGGLPHRLGGGFPVCGVRLAGQLPLPLPSLWAFGFDCEPRWLASSGNRMAAGVTARANRISRAGLRWRVVRPAAYRKVLREQYRDWLAEIRRTSPPMAQLALRLRRPVAVFPHHAPRRFRRIRQHVKERARAHPLENEPAPILVGFHPVVHAGRAKDRFQPQRFVQPLGDIYQHRILTFKKRRFLAHVSLREAAVAAIFTILGDIRMEGLMADTAVCLDRP